MATPLADGTILIPGAGEAVGVVPGTTLGLYPPGILDFRDSTHQITIATVEEVHVDAAVCRVPSDTRRDQLVPGMRATILWPGVATIRRRVALAGGAELDFLREAITGGQGSPFLEIVDLENRPELTVIVDWGHYLLRDNQDQPLPRISPTLVVSSGDSQNNRRTAEQIRQWLEHIVKYRNAWDLRNGDERSALRNQLAISVERPTSRSAGRVSLTPGDRINVCLHNRSEDEVSAALLYFSPNWEVTRIWPERGSEYALLANTGDLGLTVLTMDVLLPTDRGLQPSGSSSSRPEKTGRRVSIC